jgi:uncharacterized membrane protein YjjP (DUF1212 family)
MKFKLENLDSDRNIDDAMHSDNIEKLIRGARLRRNIYLCLFFISFLSILLCALISLPTFAIVALFLTTLSLVIITKYDIHLLFLRIIHKQQLTKAENQEQDAMREP